MSANGANQLPWKLFLHPVYRSLRINYDFVSPVYISAHQTKFSLYQFYFPGLSHLVDDFTLSGIPNKNEKNQLFQEIYSVHVVTIISYFAYSTLNAKAVAIIKIVRNAKLCNKSILVNKCVSCIHYRDDSRNSWKRRLSREINKSTPRKRKNPTTDVIQCTHTRDSWQLFKSLFHNSCGSEFAEICSRRLLVNRG